MFFPILQYPPHVIRRRDVGRLEFVAKVPSFLLPVELEFHPHVSIDPVLAAQKVGKTRTEVIMCEDGPRHTATRQCIHFEGSIGELRKDIQMVRDAKTAEKASVFQFLECSFEIQVSDHRRGNRNASNDRWKIRCVAVGFALKRV